MFVSSYRPIDWHGKDPLNNVAVPPGWSAVAGRSVVTNVFVLATPPVSDFGHIGATLDANHIPAAAGQVVLSSPAFHLDLGSTYVLDLWHRQLAGVETTDVKINGVTVAAAISAVIARTIVQFTAIAETATVDFVATQAVNPVRNLITDLVIERALKPVING